MKGLCTLVASMLAASAVALSSSPSSSSSSTGDRDLAFYPRFNVGSSSTMEKNGEEPSSCITSDKEKFAPRFDGLRFIETLVTAHR